MRPDYLKIKAILRWRRLRVKDENELQDKGTLITKWKMEINILSIEINSPVEPSSNSFVTRQIHQMGPNYLEDKIDILTTSIGTVYRQKIKITGGKVKDLCNSCHRILKQTARFSFANGTHLQYKYETVGKGTKSTYSEEEGMDKELETLSA